MTKFNHQLYKDWMLEAGDLDLQQAHDLREHIQTCLDCQQSAAALQEMEHALRSEPKISPAVGFSNRWQARLLAERRRSQRRQTFLAMGFSVGGAMMLFALLVLALLPVINNPYPAIWAAYTQVTQGYALFSGISEALASVARIIFRIVPPTLWIAIAVALGSLCVVWVIALQRFATSRRAVQ